MNAFSTLVNRFITLVIALAFLVIGGAAIAWRLNVSWVRDRIADIDAGWFDRLPDQSWWKWVLLGIVIGGIVIGIAILILDSRPRKTGTTTLAGSDESGPLTANPAKIAAAVAAELANDPQISSTTGRAIDDRKRKLLEVTVNARPDANVGEVVASVARAERHIAEALPGNAFRPRFLIHLQKNQ